MASPGRGTEVGTELMPRILNLDRPQPAIAPAIFISYAREDRAFALWLGAELERRQIVVAADWKIPTGSDYQAWLARSLDESTACLFIISEYSVQSEPCLAELRHAVRQGLRLLPVVRRSPPDDDLPKELRLPNWLFFREEDDAASQIEVLVQDARIDLDANLEARDWRQREGEWERSGRPRWFLVSPTLARRATDYYGSGRIKLSGTDPDAHARYFAALRRAYWWLKVSGLTLTILVSASLIIAGTTAWRRSQGQIAQRALSEALGLLQRDPAQALVPALLATESLSRQPSLAASELLSTLLPDISHPRRVAVIASQQEHFVSVSGDGQRVLAADVSGQLTVWNLATHGSRSQRVAGAPLLWASLSPDGMQMMTSTADRRLQVFDAESGTPRRTLVLADAASVVACTADLSRAATGGSSGLVEIWDLASGRRLDAMQHASAITAITSDHSGRWIAAASEDGIVTVWHEGGPQPKPIHYGRTVYDLRLWGTNPTLLAATADGEVVFSALDHDNIVVARLTADQSSLVSQLALSDDEEILATLSFANSIQVWHATGRSQLAIMHREPTLLRMALSGDGTWVLSAGHDDQAHLWKARTGQEFARWQLADGPRHVALSRSGEVAAIGTSSGAEVWQLTRPPRMGMWRHPSAVTRLRMNQSGTTLASVSGSRNVLLWSLETGRRFASITHPAGIADIAIDDNSSRITIADEAGSGAVYGVRDGARLCSFHTSNVQGSAAMSPDGRLAAVGSWDGDVVICDVDGGHEIARFKAEAAAKAIALPANRAEVFVGRGDGVIEQCRPGEGCRRIVEQKTPVRQLAVAPLSSLMVSTAPDALLRLWDRQTGRAFGSWSQLDFNTDVALTPSGDLVAASSERGAQVWRTQTGEELWRAERLGAVTAAALSPTGDRLAMAVGSEVRVQAINPDDLITYACRQVTRNLTEDEWHKFLPGVRYTHTCRNLP